eukprot:scpid85435/ scgid10432/ Zinc finger and BTB domain-containing protein 40
MNKVPRWTHCDLDEDPPPRPDLRFCSTPISECVLGQLASQCSSPEYEFSEHESASDGERSDDCPQTPGRRHECLGLQSGEAAASGHPPVTPRRALENSLGCLLSSLREKEQIAASNDPERDDNDKDNTHTSTVRESEGTSSDVAPCTETHSDSESEDSVEDTSLLDTADDEKVYQAAAGDVRRWECSRGCVVTFSSKRHWRRHVRSVHGADRHAFSCQSCNARFSRKDALTRHVKGANLSCKRTPCITRKYPAYYCKACEKTFPSQRAIASHRDAVHPKVKRKCPAEGCGKLFSSSNLFYRHVRGHPELMGASLACSTCGYVCVSPLGLKIHESRQHKNW